MIETPVVERESSAAPVSAGGPPRFFALHETSGGALLAGTCGRGIARAGTDAAWVVVPIDLAGANVDASAPDADGGAARRRGPCRCAAIAGRRRDVGAGSVPTAWMFSPCSRWGGTLVAGTDTGIVVRRDPEWVPAVDGPRGTVFRLVTAGDVVFAATEHEGIWSGSVDRRLVPGRVDRLAGLRPRRDGRRSPARRHQGWRGAALRRRRPVVASVVGGLERSGGAHDRRRRHRPAGGHRPRCRPLG